MRADFPRVKTVHVLNLRDPELESKQLNIPTGVEIAVLVAPIDEERCRLEIQRACEGGFVTGATLYVVHEPQLNPAEVEARFDQFKEHLCPIPDRKLTDAELKELTGEAMECEITIQPPPQAPVTTINVSDAKAQQALDLARRLSKKDDPAAAERVLAGMLARMPEKEGDEGHGGLEGTSET